MNNQNVVETPDEIAIIGLTGRFPGARTVEEFWRNLRNGVESISLFSDQELLDAGVEPLLLQRANYVKAKGILSDVDLFDASFFNFTPREAEITDPQQRLFLECAWEALEVAGYDPKAYQGLVGVYAGTSLSRYLLNLYSHPDLVEAVGGLLISLGNDKDYLATRVSYKLNLRGPSITVQTACSTSLVAVHLACQGLLNGECDMALAGGVTVNVPQKSGYLYREGGINSPNGQCRAFDAHAQGTVSGSGMGLVVLKRVADAIADGDHIHAVIKGSAVNNDGSQKVGFTAPGVQGQALVISEALRMAGVKPASISYVEAHGTGTALGDPIEIAALTQAFETTTKARGSCAIGAVKSNIGHLDAAAGIAGLIKVVLALRNKELPPSLHFAEPNPKIDFDHSPFFVNSTLREWAAGPEPRRAGVSSFGIGGTNAHVIVEEAPLLESDTALRPFQLLPLSARTETALETVTNNLAAHLRKHPDVNLADVAFTLQVGRRSFSHRRAVLCGDVEDAASALETLDSRRVLAGVQDRTNLPVVFMFSGQGAQYVNMGLGLYREEEVFREQVDLCAEMLQPQLGIDLREVLYPASVNTPDDDALARLSQTWLTQPALFVIEYALARLWMHWGVLPEAMIGHSIGEYVAACLAGVFSLEAALTIVATRGRMMQELPAGLMLAVSLPEIELASLMASGVSVAAVNGPDRFVISGPSGPMRETESRLAELGATYRQLRTSHAFHSAMMDPIREPFAGYLGKLKLAPPNIPFLSNVSGTWITNTEATDPRHWAKHLRQTVRFADGLKNLFEDPSRILLEVGPSQTLSTFARQHPQRPAEQAVIASMRSVSERVADGARLSDALGKLWLAGASIKWTRIHAGEKRLRLPLPTYPFERKPYWIEHAARTIPKTSAAVVTTEPLEKKAPPVALIQETEVPVFEVQAIESPLVGRREQIVTGLIEIIFQLTGTKLAGIDPAVSFLEVGVDSLVMIQALRAIQERFGVEIPLVHLVEELSTFGALIEHLERVVPADKFAVAIEPEPHVSPAPSTPGQITIPTTSLPGVSSAVAGDSGNSFLERVITQQLNVISQLTEVLQRNAAGVALETKADKQVRSTTQAPAAMPEDLSVRAVAGVGVASSIVPAVGSRHLEQDAWVPFQPIQPGTRSELDERQQEHLAKLTERYNNRTARSKQLTQTYRSYLADNRASTGFRLPWKELIYPIVGERSQGAYLWDVDGNKYVDLTMGFGVHLFGHSPAFIVKALHQQIEQGFQLGPQSLLAGRVAEMICKFTGMQRVTFCNSGTEAVMTALRLARTIARRDKVALFAGSYHGSFDGTLARPLSAQTRAVPVAAGIPPEMVENLLVLDYGSPESLEIVRRHGHELAAVLVEPVQSRRPSLQPGEYLHELRRITRESSTVLIFDEVITGFRVCPGGAQAWFGVEADLATYGKVVGGGMPIGIVAGRSSCMDAIDGGMWRYGDDSYPRAEKTFFAGTFCKHPLAMAGALAVLTHLEDSGPSLQEQLNQSTSRLAGALNDYFEAEQLPMRVEHFGSLMRVSVARQFKLDDLFFYHLIEKGVYFWEGRTCFLSTAHTEDDLDFVIRAVKESVEAIRGGGFLPGSTHHSPNGDSSLGIARGEPAPNALPTASIDVPEVVATDEGETRPAEVAIDELEGERETVYAPMTEAQQQLWILAQMGEKGSVAYNESITLRMHGRLQETALRGALQKVIDRHEGLRATVTPEGDRLRISAECKIEIPSLDCAGLDPTDREQQASEWVEREASQPFDLVAGPLIRTLLVKLGPESHWFVLTMHHIIIDGWSTGVLLRELKGFYESESTGIECELQQPARFAEYARERVADSGGARSRSESYWLKQFSDSVPVLELPTDHQRPALQTFSGEHARATIATSLTRQLRELSARQGSTLFATLLSGFTLLLHRLSGQDDVVVGVPVADQSSRDEQAMIGYGLNVIPLRSRCGGDVSYVQYLHEVRKSVLQGYENRNYSLTDLTQKLLLKRDPSRHPFFSVLFNLDHSRAKPRFHELDLEIVSNQTGTSKFELYLNITETADELQLELEYNTDLFERETMERWLGHYERLLESAVADGAERVSGISLLREEERRQIVDEWNATRRSYPKGQLLHELFESQAAVGPEAVAVVAEEERLTYAELNGRANRLANQLRGLGVGPDVLVGLMAERSVELVVGLLAVLKAGGAYVPVDPSYPRERQSLMLEEAGVAVLLVQERLREQVPEYEGEVVCLEACDEAMAGAVSSNPEVNVSAENLAYVIYTSGSTGRPKGVMNTHAGIVNRLLWMQETYGLTAEDCVLQKTPFSFDVSVWEFFWPLLAGARLVLAHPGGHRDGDYLCRLIAAEQVTTVHFVPSMLQAFLEEPGLAGTGSLRRVICSGEALSYELQERCLARLEAELHNLYGPTEAAVDVTYWACERGGARRAVPIGRPIANTQIYLLDRELELVPVGVAGELYIGGEGLARGYLGDPGLTAEKFIPDPFSLTPAARLYGTGDLARYRSGGEIEYLGRRDHQVKVRGFRIELGEIEAALEQYPGVREVVVVVREAAGEDKRLLAYVVAGEGARPGGDELRAFLKARLPEYLVPAVYVFLDRLPLTPNGKVDRRALPAPDQTAREAEYVAARTPLEEVVSAAWAQVLGLERVGIHDNFFDLGGHSLLAMQLVSRLRAALAVELPLRVIFESPTVEGVSAVVERLLANGRGTAPPIARVDRDRELPLSFAQQRLWFLQQLEPGSYLYNVPLALHLSGQLDAQVLGQSFNELIRRHEVLRTTFPVKGGQPRQFIGTHERMDLEVVDLRILSEVEQETEINRKIEEESSSPFDLERGPLYRLRLLRLAEDDHVLLFTMHHIISDGWSMGVLLKEISALYIAYSRGEESPLQELPIQYADYSVWQRQWLREEVLDDLIDHWRRKLAGAPAALELPTDRPRPHLQTARGASLVINFSRELSRRLHKLSRNHGATLHMTLLAAFKLLLSRYAGQKDVVVGIPVAGRGHSELEGLIGFFVNALVLRTDLSGDPTFVELLERVKRVCLEAYAHQDLPFERLVEELQPERALSRSPIFQVMFALQNATRENVAELPGLQLRPVGRRHHTSNFDLTFTAFERAGRLGVSVEYNTDLFDESTVRQMARRWGLLLRAAVRRPATKVSELGWLTGGERRRLLRDYSGIAESPGIASNAASAKHVEEWDRVSLVHEMVSEQARLTPDAPAVVMFPGQDSNRERVLTYEELEERTSKLAQYLRGLGLRAEERVGVLCRRGDELPAAALGVMQAGGAYVPLDTAHPEGRLTWTLADAAARTLLVGSGVKAPEGCKAKVVHLEKVWANSAAAAQGNLDLPRITRDSLAYVIYTSGSTGRPKGVMVTHGALSNYISQAARLFGLSCGDRLLQFASPSFDTSAEEIFTCFISGAALVPRPDEMLLSPRHFLSECARLRITAVDLPTAYWHELVNGTTFEDWLACVEVRLVIIGGERAQAEQATAWSERTGGRGRLINGYGPTEATIVATLCELRPGDWDRGRVPIGRPVANSYAYVLDADLKPLPEGVAGELYLGGAGLARGYLDRPDLTAERFIPDPHGFEAGARLYRTGDLAAWREGGALDCLGRVDAQVKVRGFRVELGEIESVLRSHTGVHDSAVVARADETGNLRLTAYLVPDDIATAGGPAAASGNGTGNGGNGNEGSLGFASLGDSVLLAAEPNGLLGSFNIGPSVFGSRDPTRVSDSRTSLAHSQVSAWNTVFDDLYSKYDNDQRPGLYIKGWDDSYSGAPMPEYQVHDWADQTAARILALRPRRVMEIGCGGSGLMLQRLAPHCEQYFATDLAENSLRVLRRQLDERNIDCQHITLERREGDDFSGIAPGTFDAILIVSVAQYFPDAGYLMRVLEGAGRSVSPGGLIFLGDVRSLPLLEAFHASVQLSRANDDLACEQVRRRVRRELLREKQLVIAPELFARVAQQRVGGISSAVVLLERGDNHNELTKFRYDVILRRDEEWVPSEDVAGRLTRVVVHDRAGSVASGSERIDWEESGLTVEELRRRLVDGGGFRVLHLVGVPNARVWTELRGAELLVAPNCPETVGELRALLRAESGDGIDPEDFWGLNGDLPYEVRVAYDARHRGGRYDVVLTRTGETQAAGEMVTEVIAETEPDVHSRTTTDNFLPNWSSYTNSPLRALAAGSLVRSVRGYLRERLPDYMIPAAFVLLERLPLTPSGKIDRRALPEPERGRPELGEDYLAPRTAVEQVVAGVWSEVLGVERVGIRDNFFELGGHSLLATQVVSRVRQALGVDVALRVMFEASTVEGVSGEVERLLASGREPAPAIERADRSRELALSFAQQRLWFLQQLEPDSYHYNIPMGLRLIGPLDAQALERSINEVVRRHESLRTSFPSEGGQPRQQIGRADQETLEINDLRQLPEAERAAEVKRMMKEHSQQPFDLEVGPVFRVRLLRVGEAEHVLLLTMHHIVSDGWSMGVLLREAATLYGVFSRGEESPLEELPIQYADYAVWQREWLRGEVLDQQLSYWRKQLAGAPSALELPTDHTRPAVQTTNGAQVNLRLSQELTRQLKELARRENATLFMVVLAAFQALLHRYTGHEEIVVGTPIAGRTSPELEGLIGFFVNTLVLRTDLSGDPSFGDLIGRVRQVCLEAYAHQDVPFEKLVEELKPYRDLSRTPLFQAMLTYDTVRPATPEFNGLRLEPVSTGDEAAKFDLTLSVVEDGKVLIGSLEYNTDLFERETMERWLGHYERLLESAVADGAERVSGISLLREEERRQIVDEWNATRRSYPKGQLLHELFESQAAVGPEAVAVVAEEERLTYAELNGRANRLANQLRGLGVGPDVLVGLMAERSVELVVGLLAVLKAGGAYVPVDPSYPRERQSLMLEEAGVAVLLVQERLREQVPEYEGEVVCLEACDEAMAGAVSSNPEVNVSAENLAYVIYTSGSTGRPKGVMNTHAGIVNRLLWMQETYGLTAEDCVLQKTPFSFDVSVWEFFWPLLAGARLVLAHPGGHRDGDYLCRLIAAEQVTTVHFVPSMLQAFLEEPGLAGTGSLRRVICSGEALSYELQERCLARLEAELHNLYGPTEAAVDVTYWACERGGARRAVPIGRPIANTQIYLLDRELELVPVGVAGELYIGGEGLARGYLGDPGLTAEKFIPDPFSLTPAARLYGTGDLARYRSGGEIEYLGRRDHQVKVRGFRIELGEIEAALEQYPGVREVVVVVREAAGEDKRLLAYVVAGEGARPGGDELRAFLKARLPEYLVPAVYVFLDRLPLTPNGKVDRRALPAPDQTAREAEYVAARTPLEEVVSAAWAQVLGLERVGIHDNFFDLGGHSLLAMQLVSRLRAALAVELPLRVIFESPTAAGVSAEVEQTMKSGHRLLAPAITRARPDGELPLSFSQERLWFLQQLTPNSPAYNIPLALRLNGALNVRALTESFAELVRRHEALRTVFAKTDGQPVQIIREAVDFDLPITKLRGLTPGGRQKKIQRIALKEAHQVFDLERGPLYRVLLLRLSAEEHVLFLTMHHIVSDGWSMGVLLREAAALYKAFSQGEASPLEDVPLHYADFAFWQRQWLRGEVLDAQLSYWRKQLTGAPPALELPSDHARSPVQSFRGANVELRIGEDLTRQLKKLSRRENATLYMTLLAAFKVLLARYARQEQIVVGTPTAGRGRSEVEGLIGCFVNTLILHTDLSGDPSFTELIGRVRRVCLEAYANQDVPFERLVEELQPERDLGRTPLFQVMFSFNTEARGSDGFEELGGMVLSSENRTAKFDLTLAISDAGDMLSGSIEYSTDLFEQATIERLAQHYRCLLESIAADATRPISRLDLLTADEQRTLLSEWNQTTADYASSQTLSEMFEAQVASTPRRTAVVCGDERLNYAQLNRKANQLAHHLRTLGVGPESLVGIMVERSVEMVVGLLGILKAGGAYLPLDSEYPRGRLSFMAKDAGLEVVLTQQRLVNQLPDGLREVICLDSDWKVIAKGDVQNLSSESSVDGTAYVLYTSGSTGEPKGVMITHGGLTNYLNWCTRAYDVAGGRGAPVHSPLGFDLTVTSILSPLLSGRSVTLLVGSQGIENLRDALRKGHGFSLVKITPAHMEMLNQLMKPEEIGGASRCLIIGGDALFGESLALWQENVPETRLINEYGPTETVVGCCVYEVPRGLRIAGAVPIGRPIANTQLYVLDETQRPVPVGVPGELYIGGAGIARGYLNRPELTAEKFVPDPFGQVAGRRLYRTGDSARYLPDGNLVYLGRADRQLKIRGYRVEPGEIEVVLRQHESVADAAVMVTEGNANGGQLVAYVISQEAKSAPAANDLRQFLKERLPEYMLPAVCVTIGEIPLTPNGKVDYRALASIEALDSGRRDRFVAPRDTLELQLAQIWQDTLNVRNVGLKDNFFETGGNSLLAVRLMSRIQKQFGQELALATLFQAPTVEQLASVLRQQVKEAWSPLVAIQPKGRRTPFFCVHPIGGNVLCYYDLARHLGDDQPFYGLQAQGLISEAERNTSIEEMATLYNRAIRAVQGDGPYYLGGYSFGGIVAFEIAQQLLRDGQHVELLALLDGGAPENAGKLADAIEDALILAELLKERARSSGQVLQIPHEQILAVPPERRLLHVLDAAKVAGVVPAEVELGWIERFLRGFKARSGAAGRYAPEIFPGRLTFFRSTETDEDTVKAMRHIGVDLDDVTLGWSRLSAEPIEVIPIPGYHETLMLEPYVLTLAEKLRSCLDRTPPPKIQRAKFKRKSKGTAKR